jgi:prepilin-type N-terminal cleavage/methylation domain-containing protein
MLARIRKAQEENEGGFTLIELLVVMIIIGILAAIAIPVFLSQKDKAKQSSVKADVHTLATDVETTLTDGTPTKFTISQAGTTATIGFNTALPAATANYQAITDRMSPNNTASGWMDANGTYCVAVTNSATTPNAVYNIQGGQLSSGACPAAPGTALGAAVP